MTKAAITHFALIHVVVCAEKHGHRGRDGFQLQKTNFGNSNNLEANECIRMAGLQHAGNLLHHSDLIRTGSEPYAPLLFNLY